MSSSVPALVHEVEQVPPFSSLTACGEASCQRDQCDWHATCEALAQENPPGTMTKRLLWPAVASRFASVAP
jgi:hypothetical protein